MQYDSILIIITLPRHVGNKQIAAQCQFTGLGSVTFRKDVTSLYALAFLTDGTKVDCHILIRTAELGNCIFLGCGLETNKLFFFCTVICNTNRRSVYKINHAIALSRNHGA